MENIQLEATELGIGHGRRYLSLYLSASHATYPCDGLARSEHLANDLGVF